MEHVASEETVQQIHNFINYGSTFGRVMKKTDLRYYYEPGRLHLHDGHLLHGKNLPRRLTTEFKDYRGTDQPPRKRRRQLLRTPPHRPDQEPSGSLVPGSGDRLDESCRKDGNPLIPTGVFQYFLRHHDPVTEGTALVAFAREGENPMEWNSRELDVHIW